MFVATLVSALVGGEVSGRDVICATVILEGLNVGKANLQPNLCHVYLQVLQGYYLRA